MVKCGGGSAWASVCPQGEHSAEFVAGGIGETEASRRGEGVRVYFFRFTLALSQLIGFTPEFIVSFECP